MAVNTSFSFLSYNSTGWSEYKSDTLNTQLTALNVSIGALQEHLQLKENLHRIDSKLVNYTSFSIPAYKRNDMISQGRPSGGLSFIVRRDIEQTVRHFIVPNSKRVHGLFVKLPETNLVLINCYFPNDPQNNNFDDACLLETIQDVKYILNSCNINDVPILLGDFNCDFSRDSQFVNIVKNFLSEYNLQTVWSYFDCDFTYCHPTTRNNRVLYSFSKIDHFILNENIIDCIEDASVLHLGENLSNHDSIYLRIKCQNFKNVNTDEVFISKGFQPSWKKASPEHIKALQDTFKVGLEDIPIPNETFICRDLHCSRDSHLEDVDVYAVKVLSLLEDCVEGCIPNRVTDNREHVPQWKTLVKPIKDDLNFWYAVWTSAGKPVNCQLHNIYRNLRHKYHYQIRRLKLYKQEMKNNNFITAATSGKVNDILKTLKAHRKGKKGIASTVDNIQGQQNISNHFQGLYENIYNHHAFNNIIDLSQSIENKVSPGDMLWIDKVTPSLVSKVLQKLKYEKSDEHFSFTSNAMKLTAEVIAKPLSYIFKAYLIHGHFTNNFLLSSLIPIVKNKVKSSSDSSNYRLIAISSLLLKVMDLLILELCSECLTVSSLQFGFESNSSTTLCSWTLQETISYFITRDTPVYLCFLDLKKAFDHVKLDILFDKLKSRLPGIFVRLLFYTYVMQQCYVRWGSTKSNTFFVTNGVRQGAVASPVLFNIYIDELFATLRNSKIGCTINGYFYGALGYADDISLLCPTREGLQKLVDIVSVYCDEYGITISTDPDPSKSKTKCIIFNCNVEPCNIKLYNLDLPYVDQWEHLGHTIHKDGQTSHDIMKSRAIFISKIHSLHQELGRVHPKVFMILVQIYLTAFYGATLWDLDSFEATKLYSTYNMIRNTYDLPFGTHRFILKEVSAQKPLQQKLYDRFIKFSDNIKKSTKPEVINLFHTQKLDSRSVFGRNYKNILIRKKEIPAAYRTPENVKWKISLINEICDIKFGSMIIKIIDNFSLNMLDLILKEICT